MDEEGDDTNYGYSWIGSKVEKTWDSIIQDEDHGLISTETSETLRRNRNDVAAKIKRGIIRFVFVILDFSKATEAPGFTKKISLNTDMCRAIEDFIKIFFDQNPLSHLGLIVCRNGIAEKISELSGTAKPHLDALKEQLRGVKSDSVGIREKYIGGQFSLQNCLLLAQNSLKFIPKHGHKEILLCVASLTTCDPGNITDTFRDILKNPKDPIRVSIVGHHAEVFVFRNLSTKTNGTYLIARNYEHYKELLLKHSPPPATIKSVESNVQLIPMGFPNQITDDERSTPCVCHKKFSHSGYTCPRCLSKYCELPVDCEICRLTLVSSSHIARSYHHLFPIQPYHQVLVQKTETEKCSSCLFPIKREKFICPQCKNTFCADCEEFIHTELHNCPFCR